MNKINLKSILIFFFILGVISIISYILGFSLCAFYNITGVYCPSCGMTRAYVSLLHLDIRQAFYYNPVFLIIPLIIFPFIIEQFFFKIKKSTKTMYFSILIIILIVAWIIRLYLYFPNPPVEYNYGSLLSQLYSTIKYRFR